MLLLDESITQVTLLRGKIGAVQKNDLETGARNLRTYRENLTASESIIRDTDYAHEISNLTKQQILQQASTAMLAQNNNDMKNIVINTEKVEKAFEKLSSGLRINRAADSPASLVISERLRSQIASVDQALANTETDISVLQTAEAALEEINNTLVHMRQLTVHAANEGANDKYALEADQKEIEESMNAIDRIVRNTSFGAKKLLDGSSGVGAITTNPLLEFVDASPNTKASDLGYEVSITQTATKSVVVGKDVLTDESIQDGETLRIIENGKVAEYTTKREDNLLSVISNLNNIIKRNGLDVEVSLSENNKLVVMHKYYGSKYGFSVSSTTGGVLGFDVAGYINGEAAKGTDRFCAVCRVRRMWTDWRSANSEKKGTGGEFGQTTKVAIGNINTQSLGRGIENESGFKRLAEISVLSHQSASDAMLLLDESITQVPYCATTLCPMVAVSDGDSLTGLYFEAQQYFPNSQKLGKPDKSLTLLKQTADQIKAYLAGHLTEFTLPLAPSGTDFQLNVWKQLRRIPYGKTVTYRQIAEWSEVPKGFQAVGGCIGRNPLGIIVPCHRVIGSDGSLTGYAGGKDKKQTLLSLEAGVISAVRT
ncbi:hypothetical protein CHS0354_027420 [Potamilus streckersoni]|uniref:Methylated-DNA--protein-cysteine methyltransferase n=1 Tax=Potamilus streckersoni TaxID=2493646 RepID=A0AAE0SQA4_9BIVA|nr:hypothetical protein CHS0354_027420 [Potamilus streckersoni]